MIRSKSIKSIEARLKLDKVDKLKENYLAKQDLGHLPKLVAEYPCDRFL